MRSTSLLVFASFLAVALGQGNLVINTPAPPDHCEPTLLSWSGGVPPYILTVADGNDPTQILESFGTLTNLSITWQVTERVGQACLLVLKDNTGLTQTSAVITVQPGTTTCDASSSSSHHTSTGTKTSTSGTKVGTSAAKSSASKSTATSSAAKKSSATVSTITVGVSTKPSASTATVSGSLSTVASSTAPGSPVPSNIVSALPSPSSSSSGAGPTGVPAAAAAAAIGAVFAALI